MATLLSTDSFVRANNTTNPGSTDGAGKFDPGAWVTGDGAVGISSNRFYASSTGGSSIGAAYIDFGVADIDASVTRGAANVGILLRYADANNYVMYGDMFGGIAIYKYIFGVMTLVFQGGAAANGDVFRVVVTANIYRCYQNGALAFTVQESFLEHKTKHGVAVAGTNLGKLYNWTASTVDPPHTYQIYGDSGMSVTSPLCS